MCLVNNCSDILGNVMSFDKLVVYFNLVRLLRWCVHKVRFIYFKYAVVYLLQFLSLFDITEWSIALSRINCWTTCKTNWFILKPGWIIWRAEPAQVFDLPWKLKKYTRWHWGSLQSWTKNLQQSKENQAKLGRSRKPL